jgi:hypothetical protein
VLIKEVVKGSKLFTSKTKHCCRCLAPPCAATTLAIRASNIQTFKYNSTPVVSDTNYLHTIYMHIVEYVPQYLSINAFYTCSIQGISSIR